jgi:holo-[acyl-carrier protein] synthase
LQEYGLTKIKKMEIRQGIDLLKIKRIEKIYKKYEHKFLKKFFSDKEIEQINNSKVEKVKKIAGKISSKEAASKALGTGISNGITFKDFEILNESNGCPKLNFYGVAKTKLKNLSSSSISITHDGEYIVSVVTLLLNDK